MSSQVSECAHLFKLLLVGDSCVGKSSLLLRFIDNTFSEQFISTIGVDFKIKTIEVGGKIIKLQIWDTAGQERFRTITSSYYRGAHGIILVYDISDMSSFNSIKLWLQEVEKFAMEDATKILVGNKCDLESERKVDYDTGKQLADTLEIPFIETSGKDNYNVTAMFTTLTEEIMEQRSLSTIKKRQNERQQFRNRATSKKKNICNLL